MIRIALLAAFAAAARGQSLEAVIAKNADSIKAKLIENRRYFHMHPELSTREVETGKAIAERLRAMGYDDIKTGVAKNGVVALLKGGKPGPVIAWRADIDGLPIEETNNVPYKSQNAGVKHACGHDTHIAIGLAVAEVLMKSRADLPGTVKFIFQPAEEGPPFGEEGGASLMVKEGVLENPKVTAIFGLHIAAFNPAGKLAYSRGPLMASADSFTMTIKGKKAHAAWPHLGIDPIVIASQCVLALQTIKSRRIDNTEPLVLTVGSIHGGNRENILADEVTMLGTLRTLSEKTREDVHTMMRQTLEGCTAMSGGSYELKWKEPKYPVTENNAALVEKTLAPLRRVFGDANVIEVKPVMGGEDFSYYQKLIPGFFWFLGAANEAKGITAAHHTADFDIDEDVLLPGVKAAASQLAFYLESVGSKSTPR